MCQIVGSKIFRQREKFRECLIRGGSTSPCREYEEQSSVMNILKVRGILLSGNDAHHDRQLKQIFAYFNRTIELFPLRILGELHQTAFSRKLTRRSADTSTRKRTQNDASDKTTLNRFNSN